MNGNNESANEKERAISPLSPPLLKILEDMLHTGIIQKKGDIHKTTQSIVDTDRIWTEIDTDIAMDSIAHTSSSIRRQLAHERYY